MTKGSIFQINLTGGDFKMCSKKGTKTKTAKKKTTRKTCGTKSKSKCR